MHYLPREIAMKTSSESHEFAFYTELIKQACSMERGSLCVLTQKELAHRLLKVLRLAEGDRVVFFDNQYSIKVILAAPAGGSSTLSFFIDDVRPHMPLKPAIHWLLPLLKRDAFEEALYSLVEIGATSVHPFVSTKTGRNWLGERERSRCRSLMIAAAEQSKNFLIPSLYPVSSLAECLSRDPSYYRARSYSSLFLMLRERLCLKMYVRYWFTNLRPSLFARVPKGILLSMKSVCFLRKAFFFVLSHLQSYELSRQWPLV